MPRSPKELERIGEELTEKEKTFELEDTAINTPEASPRHMPLNSALDMKSSDISFAPVQRRPPKKPLPAVPPTAFKGSEERKARRGKTPSPSCSIFCDEEEAIFPVRKWNKPLAGMGDALNWKLSVLNRFNAIQY